MKILLFAAFRTGSNYARSLFENNYDIEVCYNLLGWKHGPIPSVTFGSQLQYPDLEDVCFLVVVKDPYATFVSWFDYLKNKKHNIKTEAKNFSEFLRLPVVYFNEDRKGQPEYYFSSPADMWNFIVWNHCSFVDKNNGYVVRYEDLLIQPECTVRHIAEEVGAKQKNAEFENIEKRVLNMGDSKKKREKEGYATKEVFDKKTTILTKSI